MFTKKQGPSQDNGGTNAKTFATLSKDEIVIRAIQTTPGAVSRTDKNSKTVYELRGPATSGKITDIYPKPGMFGQELHVVIDKNNSKIDSQMNHIDYTKNVSFEPCVSKNGLGVGVCILQQQGDDLWVAVANDKIKALGEEFEGKWIPDIKGTFNRQKQLDADLDVLRASQGWDKFEKKTNDVTKEEMKEIKKEIGQMKRGVKAEDKKKDISDDDFFDMA